MSLSLPGSRNIFSTMQNAFSSTTKGRLALDKGFHHALNDFRWMHGNISTCPTRIAKLVLLPPAAEGHHDAPVLEREKSGSQALPSTLDKGIWQPLLLYGDMNGPTAFPPNL